MPALARSAALLFVAGLALDADGDVVAEADVAAEVRGGGVAVAELGFVEGPTWGEEEGEAADPHGGEEEVVVAGELADHDDGGEGGADGGGEVGRHTEHGAVGQGDSQAGEKGIKECARACTIDGTAEERGAEHAAGTATANGEAGGDGLDGAKSQEQTNGMRAEVGEHAVIDVEGLLDGAVAGGKDLGEDEGDGADKESANGRFGPGGQAEAAEDDFGLAEEEDVKADVGGDKEGQECLEQELDGRGEGLSGGLEDGLPAKDAGVGHVGDGGGDHGGDEDIAF